MARLDAEVKQITHAIRMAAYNAEPALVRALDGHHARAADEAYALIREALTAPRRIQALACPAHPGRKLLSRHRPRPALPSQIPPKPCINDLPMAGVPVIGIRYTSV